MIRERILPFSAWRGTVSRFVPGGSLQEVMKGAASVLVIRMIGALLAYGLQTLLARWMGGYEYGVYAYAWVWVTILGFLGPMGLHTASLRFVADYAARARFGRLKGVIRQSSIIVAAASVAIMIIGWTTLKIGEGWLDHHYVLPFLLALAAVPFFSLTALNEGVARGLGYAKLAYFPSYVLRPALTLAGALLALQFSLPMSGSIIMAVAVAATVFAFAFQSLLLARRLPAQVTSATARVHTAHWIGIALPFLMVEAFQIVLVNADVVMIGHYMTPNDVGVYFASMRTCNLLQLVFFAMSALATPTYSALYATGDLAALKSFVRRVAHVIFWPSLLACLGLVLVGKFLLSLFGESFTAGYGVMLVLLIGILVKAATGPLEGLLTMTGHQKPVALITGLSAVLNILLNTALIPAFGIVGAAIATSATMALSVLAMHRIAIRRLGVNTFVLTRR